MQKMSICLCSANDFVYRTMSKWHVDNLITHLCALSLIVDNFTTDTHDLREDLGLTPAM